MYFLYSVGGVTFNKCWITLSILNWYSPNFQGFILMKNALNNQVGMLGDMFLWLVANLKQGIIYFIKQALPPNKSAGSVHNNRVFQECIIKVVLGQKVLDEFYFLQKIFQISILNYYIQVTLSATLHAYLQGVPRTCVIKAAKPPCLFDL